MAKKQQPTDDRLARRAREIEALRTAEHDTAFAGDQREMTGETSQVAQHPADVADFTYQRELQLTTGEILNRELEQVEEARRRQVEGTYGICQNCGRQISAERLRARPAATLCIDCQRQQEGAPGVGPTA
jgi:RNA polymerase-binding protein DksA